MKSLTFIHLAVHTQLAQQPSFKGLVNLKSLSLAMLRNVQVVPSFESTERLERLELILLFAITTLPDLAPLKRLVYFAYIDRGMPCCNGVLGTPCNLSQSVCQVDTTNHLPAATCLQPTDPHATNATQGLFQKFQSNVCVRYQFHSISGTGPNICNDVAYRRCPANAQGDFGICVTTRMMVIKCDYSPYFVALRIKQIERGIGVPCDPDEESWLGCMRAD